MSTITIHLDACTVFAQCGGDGILFEVRSRAEGAEPFTIAGPEFQRLLRAWNTLTLQQTIERARELASEAPPPPPPKPDPLTRLIAWLNTDVTGGSA
jgi:hypothetical protein